MRFTNDVQVYGIIKAAPAVAIDDVVLLSQLNDAIVGLWDDRGNYNASSGVYPSIGGSGIAGTILKGDIWTTNVAGIIGGISLGLGDTIRALVDTPGQTSSNWAIAENNLGYTPVPDTRSLTINGVTQDLSADRTWEINPAGSDRQIQFNNSGTFGASSNFHYDVSGNVHSLYVGDQSSTNDGRLVLGGSSGKFILDAVGGPMEINAADQLTINITPSGNGFHLKTNNTDRLNIGDNGSWTVGASTGTTGQVLTSNGSSTAPTWTSVTIPTLQQVTNAGSTTNNSILLSDTRAGFPKSLTIRADGTGAGVVSTVSVGTTTTQANLNHNKFTGLLSLDFSGPSIINPRFSVSNLGVTPGATTGIDRYYNLTKLGTFYNDGRISGANAVNSDEYVTLSQADTLYTPSSGSSSYIQNQTASYQTASYKIIGSGELWNAGFSSQNKIKPDGIVLNDLSGGWSTSLNYTNLRIGNDSLGNPLTLLTQLQNGLLLLRTGNTTANLSASLVTDNDKTFQFNNSGGVLTTVITTPVDGALLKWSGTTGLVTNVTSSDYVSSITGTANQVIASSSTGAVTLSLPQNIAVVSTPTFGGMTLTGLLTGTVGSFSGTVGAANLSAASAGFIQWSARARLYSPGDGVINLTNNANSAFTRLNLGPNTASFAALKRVGTGIQFRSGDDTAYGSIAAANGVFNGTVTQSVLSSLLMADASGVLVAAVPDVDYVQVSTLDDYVQVSTLDDYVQVSSIGMSNGVAPLGPDNKVPTIYLPTGGLVYKGTWNASTNSPTLADGTGTEGDMYRVSVSGSQDLGSGTIAFTAGDDIIYDGSAWQRAPSSNLVSSVNGYTGTIVLTSSDIGSPATSLTITAGNGLTGGGSLAANRTLTLGTPSNITLGSTNSVTTTSHTHAFVPGGTSGQYIDGTGSLQTFPSIPAGTVTSVGLSLPSIFSVTGSPVTSSGTLTGTLASQTANFIFAAPNGSNGAPTFRALVAADIPTLNQNTTGSAATLTTTRTLWGQNFNGSANVSGNMTSVGTIASGKITITNTTADLLSLNRPSSNASVAIQAINSVGTSTYFGRPQSGFFAVSPNLAMETSPYFLIDNSGQSIFSSSITWGLRTNAAATSSIYNTATSGTVIFTGTGSTSDLNLLNGAGLSVFTIPTGTRNILMSAGTLTVGSITALGTAATTFLTHTSGLIQSRTAAQVLSDIGAVSSTAISGTTNTIPKFISASSIGNSNIRDLGTNIYILSADVTKAARGNLHITTTDAPAINKGGVISFGGVYSTVNGETPWASIGGLKENATDGNYSGYLYFSTRVNGSNLTEIARFDSGGNFGIGTTAISARSHIVSTSEQLRLGYNVSNYLRAVVGSTGSTFFDLVGTSPEFSFGKNVSVTGNILSDGNITAGTTSRIGFLGKGGLIPSSSDGIFTLVNNAGITNSGILNLSALRAASNIAVTSVSGIRPLSGPVLTMGAITPGSGYTDGVYTNTNTTVSPNNGKGLQLNITVSGGEITDVQIAHPGVRYLPNDVVMVSAEQLGGTGSGFSVLVGTVDPVDVYVSTTTGGKLRLEADNTSVVTGTVLGGIYFSVTDNSTKGTGDAAKILAKAVGSSGGGIIEFHTSQNAISQASLGMTLDNNKDLTVQRNIISLGLTASRVVVSNANKVLVSSTTTTTEIGYVSGVTSAIQTQLNGKQATLSGTGLVKSTDETISYITDNSTNWNTAFSQTRQWDGGATGLTAATARTSLGGTTFGQNLFTLPNPSFVSYLQVNANNTVVALSASGFTAAIGALPLTAGSGAKLTSDLYINNAASSKIYFQTSGVDQGTVGTDSSNPGIGIKTNTFTITSSSNIVRAIVDGSGLSIYGGAYFPFLNSSGGMLKANPSTRQLAYATSSDLPGGPYLSTGGGTLTGKLTINTSAADGLEIINAGTTRFSVNSSAQVYAQNLLLGSAITLPTGSLATTQSQGDNSAKIATTGYVDTKSTSGSYIPTITNGANVSSSSVARAHYMCIDSEVIVSGSATISPSLGANTQTVFEISLPISSNLVANDDVRGSGSYQNATLNGAARVDANTTNDRAIITYFAPVIGGGTIYFTFMYRII